MGLLLKQLFGFIKLLNSETGHNQIAAGVACGFILGMTPLLSLQSLLVFLLIFFFRIQAGAAFISAFFFAFIAWVFDPLFHQFGSWFLSLPSLQGLWTELYNMPLVPLTRFNNSVVMGSGVFAILCFPLVFFASKWLVKKYRRAVVDRIKSTKFWKGIQATSLYKRYYSYENLYG